MKLTFVRHLLAGLALVVGTTTAFAANVLSVKEKVELSVPPDKAWALIKDFDGWQNWHPAIASTEITSGKNNSHGEVRVLTTKDGGKITEKLVRYQPKAFGYTYSILESPLPVTEYTSTVQVKATQSGSVVTWASHFKAKEGTADADAIKTIRDIYRAGLDNLKAKLK